MSLRKKLVSAIVSIDQIWNLMPQAKTGIWRNFFYSRNGVIDERVKEKVSKVGVLTGTFKGMQYNTHSFSSAFWPKLLGTYENELNQAFAALKDRTYQIVLDVGCAEGYYAVGLARWESVDHVYAFDLEVAAQEYCLALAKLNRVEGKVTIKSKCSWSDLGVCMNARSLIICDCEGYEVELFDEKALHWIASSDLVIECHDHIVPGATGILLSRLQATHDCQLISAVKTEGKLRLVKQLLGEKNLDILQRLVDEGRPEGMSWLFANPKNGE